MVSVSRRDTGANLGCLICLVHSTTDTMSDVVRAAVLSLTDLPDSWLLQLPEALDAASRLALFRTCRAMRGLLLSQAKTRLRLQLPNSADHAIGSLLLACSSPRLTLVDSENHHARVEATSAAITLMSSAMAAAGEGLKAIRSVTLQTLDMDSLAPSWLISACPNMTSLQLRSCRFHQLPDPATSIPTCAQLTHLRLHPPPIVTAHPSIPDVHQFPEFQHQLRSLPGLASLALSAAGYYGNGIEDALRCCSVLGTQLTQLTCSAGSLTRVPSAFQSLRDVELNIVDDEGMEALLGLTNLKRVQCTGFKLQHSYVHRQYQWDQLSVRWLGVAALARLPLEAVQPMRLIDGGELSVYASNDLELTRAGVVAASGWGARQWGASNAISMTSDEGWGQAIDGDALAASLGLLATCPNRNMTLLLRCASITPSALASMAQHLTNVASITFDACIFGPLVLPLLLASLPPSVGHVCFDRCRLFQDETVAMCARACRPIKVEVGGTWAFAAARKCCRKVDGLPGCVRAAMANAGHQHVQFSIFDQMKLLHIT